MKAAAASTTCPPSAVGHGGDKTIKAIATVKVTVGGLLSNLGISRGLDGIYDLLGKSLLLELVSAELDPSTGLEKETLKAYARQTTRQEEDEVRYETDFVAPQDFGVIGAVMVENEHRNEMYLKDIIILDGASRGHFTCNSFVQSKFDNPDKRIFFSDNSYLPSQTPGGLKGLREKELENLRGNGKGERKTFDRIYDYDTYNDLGDPDSEPELARPVLGGKEHPYPRRCRTGRPHCKTDEASETRSTSVYVPRDEQFADIKRATFSINVLSSVLHALIPDLEALLVDTNVGFPSFTDINALFDKGLELPDLKEDMKSLRNVVPELLKDINDAGKDVLCFKTPEMLDRDEFSWLQDDEFARETLAGLNPYGIRLVTEWPLKSKLDPKTYGPPESAFTSQLIETQLEEPITVSQAIEQKKLFILDYHDILLPYVHKVRQIQGTTLYGSRTLFFLTPRGTLKPLAIELSRPPADDGKPQWKQVLTPGPDVTNHWLWRIAKVHVLAHDSAYHELISHWLRTHCCTEPYIIAANRQLSAMHPVYRLLSPHFRYTMEINALAREALINADGIIESAFSTRRYSMELSSVIYQQEWRFDRQALPADLISRGMAIKDASAPHGLKLTIEDYPFANDGLLLWDAIMKWVTEYVRYYYPEQATVASDKELEAWWAEIRTEGHGDKKDEPWWPLLQTQDDLIQVITTMIWVSSGHHAAVNFGQYEFAGYFPNRPTIARATMPTEDPTEEKWKRFMEKPDSVLLETFPSQIQATKIMAILAVLSSHSPDEEYIGDRMEASWSEDPTIKAAFERFHGRLKELEKIIDARNSDTRLSNRSGTGIIPYELLKPFSKSGMTGMGVPNSISI